jgi:hypothetical protein
MTASFETSWPNDKQNQEKSLAGYREVAGAKI